MKNDFMKLKIVDDRDIPKEYLEKARNNNSFCLGEGRKKIHCNLKAMYIYTMIIFLIDSSEDEDITVSDLKKVIIETSSKKDAKRFGTDAIIRSQIKELIDCEAILHAGDCLYIK